MNANLIPPNRLPPYLLSVFFLITNIICKNVAFLVVLNGRPEWLILDQRLIDAVIELQLRIPLAEIDWQELCQHFLTNFTTLPFYVNQGIQEIEWCNVVFVKRNLQIRLEDGTEVLAKYIENFGEMWCERSGRNEHYIRCQIRGTDEEVIIPISAIVNHILSKKVVSQYDEKLAQQKAKEKAARDAEEANQKSESYRAFMIRKGNISDPHNQKYYPTLSDKTMRVLFVLCKRTNVNLSFTYAFNLLIRRLIAFGDQSRFHLPEFSEDDENEYSSFCEKYYADIVGRPIWSKTIRFQQFGRIADNLMSVLEYFFTFTNPCKPSEHDIEVFIENGEASKVALQMAALSESALALPDIFWTQPEIGVLTKVTKSVYPMIQVLFPMPKEFPKDFFE